MLATAVAAVSS